MVLVISSNCLLPCLIRAAATCSSDEEGDSILSRNSDLTQDCHSVRGEVVVVVVVEDENSLGGESKCRPSLEQWNKYKLEIVYNRRHIQ